MFPEPERLTSEILGCTQRSVTAKEALKPLAHDPRPVARDSSTATEVSGCGGRELGDDVVSLPHVTCKFAHTVVSRDKVKCTQLVRYTLKAGLNFVLDFRKEGAAVPPPKKTPFYP